MKDLFIWAEKNLVDELHKVDAGEDLRIWAAEEQQIHDDFNYKTLKKCNSVEFLFGAVSHSEYRKASKIGKLNLWWNFWLFKALETIEHTPNKANSFRKLFISLNNRPHYHRCRLMDELHKQNLAHKGIISWHVTDTPHYDWKFWNPKQLNLSMTIQ